MTLIRRRVQLLLLARTGSACVLQTHRQGCTVQHMMHMDMPSRATRPQHGICLEVLRLVRLARGHHSPQFLGAGHKG